MLTAGCILPQLGAQAFLAVIKDMDDWSASRNVGYGRIPPTGAHANFVPRR